MMPSKKTLQSSRRIVDSFSKMKKKKRVDLDGVLDIVKEGVTIWSDLRSKK